MGVEARIHRTPDLKSRRIRNIRSEQDSVSALSGELERANRLIKDLEDKLQAKNSSSNDPDGYYYALGLHPKFAQGLTEAQKEQIIKTHVRIFSMVHHPDRGGSLERMKKINAARDHLMPKRE